MQCKETGDKQNEIDMTNMMLMLMLGLVLVVGPRIMARVWSTRIFGYQCVGIIYRKCIMEPETLY